MNSLLGYSANLSEVTLLVTVFLMIILSCILAMIESLRATKYKKLYKKANSDLKVSSKQRQIFRSELEKFANLLDQINFPIWQRNGNLDITYCNRSYCEVIGDIRENIISNPEVELFREAKGIAKSALSSGHTKVVEENVIINGRNTLNQIIEIPINQEEESGGATRAGSIGFALNFVELQNTRERLKHNVELQNRLMDSLVNAVAIFGPNRRLEYYNKAYIDLWKFDEDWLKTSPLYEEVLEVLRQKRKLPEQADFKSFKQSQVDMFFNLIEKEEEYFYLTDGTVLKIVIIPYQQRGLLFYYEDMTNNLNLERSYNTLLSVQKQTLDNLNEAVSLFGEDGRVKLYNPTFSDIWWLSKSFLHSDPHIQDIMQKIKYLFYGTDFQKFEKEFTENLNSREQSQIKVTRKDGVVLIINFMPLPDGGNLVTYFDVTDKENLERSLRAEKLAYEEADRIKTNFLNNVSYELRSPLTSIMGFSEILTMNDNFSDSKMEKEKGYLDAIFDSSMKLKYLIDNIIDVSSIDAGYVTLEVEEHKLDDFLKELMPQVDREANKRDIVVDVEIEEKDLKVEIDSGRLRQALSALVSNAIIMSEKGSRVNLKISKVRDNVRFEVEDTGIGINKEDLPQIFNQFFKVQADSSHGTGLGLYLSKRIIELHGGFIIAESEEGGGSKFLFEIPTKHDLKDI